MREAEQGLPYLFKLRLTSNADGSSPAAAMCPPFLASPGRQRARFRVVKPVHPHWFFNSSKGFSLSPQDDHLALRS